MRDLLSKPLVVVTGKGGVGKSTVAAALGTAAAARGLRTIVAAVSARDDVSRAFDASGGTFAERDLGDGLHHISIDPESALEEYVKDQLPRGVSDVLASSRMFSYLVAATPGLRPITASTTAFSEARNMPLASSTAVASPSSPGEGLIGAGLCRELSSQALVRSTDAV